MLYSKNLYNETALLAIPIISLTNSEISQNKIGICYNIHNLKTNKNALYFLTTLYI
jgi:hypothetical protein